MINNEQMSFTLWKRSYQQDRICRTPRSLSYWLRIHGVEHPPLENDQTWICTTSSGQVVLKQWYLEMSVQGLSSVYKRCLVSLETPVALVHEAYFAIYGNLCRIQDLYTRLMQYPRAGYTLQRGTIFARVKPLWREERASHTIDRFLWNCCHPGLTVPRRERTRSMSPRMEACSPTELTTWYSDAFHQHIIDYFIRGLSVDVQAPRLVLIFGLPGSGKNWALEKKREKGHVHINIDDIRALLPKYWKRMVSVSLDDTDWIAFLSQECQAIAQKLFDHALGHRMNIVWNGTGKNVDKYERLLNRAKRRGYVTELRYIWVPLDVARARVRQRSQDIGRTVPEEVIQKALRNIPLAFQHLTLEADHARIFENQERSPTMIWDKTQGWSCTPRRRKSVISSI